MGLARNFQVVRKDDTGEWNDLIPKTDIPSDIISFMGRTGYEDMPYKELLKLAKEKGVFRVGMKRSELINALNNG